jgi:hypothetical protein
MVSTINNTPISGVSRIQLDIQVVYMYATIVTVITIAVRKQPI